MAKLPLDLSKFSKVSSDKHTTTLKHDKGHTIKLAHGALEPKLRKQLESLPMADGGKVTDKKRLEIEPIEKTSKGGVKYEEILPKKPRHPIDFEAYAEGGRVDKGPKIDPQKAKAIESGALESGWQPQRWKKNLKEGLGFANGGEIDASDMDPQSAMAAQGLSQAAQAALDSGPQTQDSIEPESSPIDYIAGGAGARLGKAMVGDAGAVLGNNIGSVGNDIKQGRNLLDSQGVQYEMRHGTPQFGKVSAPDMPASKRSLDQLHAAISKLSPDEKKALFQKAGVQMKASGGEIDPSDMDPQSAMSALGMKQAAKYALDSGPQTSDSIEPESSPIDYLAGSAGAKLGGAMARDAGQVLGNNIGSVGSTIKNGPKTIGLDLSKELQQGLLRHGGFDDHFRKYITQAGDNDELLSLAQAKLKPQQIQEILRKSGVQFKAQGGRIDNSNANNPKLQQSKVRLADGGEIEQESPININLGNGQTPIPGQQPAAEPDIVDKLRSGAAGLKDKLVQGIHGLVGNEPSEDDEAQMVPVQVPDPTPPPAPEVTDQMKAGMPAPTADQRQLADNTEQNPLIAAKMTEAQAEQSADMNKIQALNQEAAAKGGLNENQARIEQQTVNKLTQEKVDYDSHLSDIESERTAVLHDIENSHIDPSRYLGSLNTTSRVATAIGLVLGGLGAGLTGGKNPALEFLNNQIDRDIDAQKAELGKKETILSANMKRFQDLNQAHQMTKLNMLDISAHRIAQAAAASSSPVEKSRAQMAIADIQKSGAAIASGLAFNKTLLAANKGPGGLRKMDPSMLVSQMVPKEQQKEVYKEIQAAQNTRHMEKNIMSAFEQSVRDNRGLGRIGALLKTPRSNGALHQHMQPTFADLEGTVRQAAMDNTFNNITPHPADNERDTKIKRKALQEYIQSKKSAPTAKAHGIDLSQYESTNVGAPQPDVLEKMKAFVAANPNDPRTPAIRRKLGI